MLSPKRRSRDRRNAKERALVPRIPHVSTVTKVITVVMSVAAVAAPKKWQ